MKQTKLLLMIAVVAAFGGLLRADVIWSTDCTSLTGWGEGSAASNEPGPTTGGIRTEVIDVVTLFHMNSWWDGAGWTGIWTNTGATIQANAEYTITYRMISWADGPVGVGKPVYVNIQNAATTPNWTLIHEQNIIPTFNAWGDVTISFSTAGGANAGAVGGQIGLNITPDWWNNVGIDSITINKTILAVKNPSPANDANPSDDLNAAGEPSTSYSGKVKVQLAWDTMEDPNQPGVVYNKVTKHYLYVKAGEPNFVGVAPVEIPTGSPVIARPTYLLDNLNYNGIYYWQIKESINNSMPSDSNTVAGPVWVFETIQESPVMITSPADILVAQGNPAMFTAEIVSASPISCRWYLSVDKANNTPSDDTLLGTTSVSNYTITSTPMSYAGKYVFCVVSNSSPSTASSQPALLEVERLIGWWKMDNNLNDSSGNGWTGMYSLPTVNYQPGRVGNALELSSDPNHVTIVNTENAFNFYHLGMTVSVWVKSATPAWGAILAKEDRTGTAVGWEVMLDWQGHPAFTVVGGGSSTGAVAVNVCDDQWHLITGVYNKNTLSSSIYVDGELRATSGAGSATVLPCPSPVLIGALLTDGNTPFGGLIDDVRIYTYPKTNFAVLDLYNEIADPDKKLCLLSYGSAGDINGDCKVNLEDFAIIATNWLSCGLYPVCP